jgi:NifQ.
MANPILTAADTYRLLFGSGQDEGSDTTGEGAGFDRHVFACVLAIGCGEADRPLTDATGLSRVELAQLFARYFPHATDLIAALPTDAEAAAIDEAIEEPDLRQLLLDNRTQDTAEATWLAAIVARRSLGANHLWQDLGLSHRGDLSRLLNRHFAPLASRNTKDMKWKKFFYRELCGMDGIFVCKAPNCEVCTDVGICFAEETGDPLLPLRRPAS